ncbi:hypothetical protein CCYN2B_250045 [Capnocytophaga cynodegmi]|nr:hypothetical protein CCYN2B_250045 [Capnocytophaga cynodegmi]
MQKTQQRVKITYITELTGTKENCTIVVKCWWITLKKANKDFDFIINIFKIKLEEAIREGGFFFYLIYSLLQKNPKNNFKKYN